MVPGFGGRLETFYCARYLPDEKGYKVHSVLVNTGGFSVEELTAVEGQAYRLGVKTHTTIDAVRAC